MLLCRSLDVRDFDVGHRMGGMLLCRSLDVRDVVM